MRIVLKKVGYFSMIQKPDGTRDITPEISCKWQYVEKKLAETAMVNGFKEIRVPTFEKPELFIRSVGETTDVVQKEMYKVIAKETEFALRPEGTAGVIRAMYQNSMLNSALPQKVYYIASCFRHERPQAGRLREFHQFGVEVAGSAAPIADASVIALANDIIMSFGIKNIALNINSIGCSRCRPQYYEALKEYFIDRKRELCGTCKERLFKNPMRILDCKNSECQEVAEGAPVIVEYLCNECKTHFAELKKHLKDLKIDFEINPKIVRGLDYYTKTVFEFVSDDIGSQGTVCGGGRYDGLIEELCGKSIPALGFGMGLERLIMIMESQKIEFPHPETPKLFLANAGDNAIMKIIEIAHELRNRGHYVEYDIMDRPLKAQMKYADKIGAEYVAVIGGTELSTGLATLKNMRMGVKTEVTLDSNFASYFENYVMDNENILNELAHRLGVDIDDVETLYAFMKNRRIDDNGGN